MQQIKCENCDGTGFIEAPKGGDARLMIAELNQILQSPRAKVTTGRMAKLKTRLKTYEWDEIKVAAQNLVQSDWHMGDNPGGVKYANVDFLLRTDEQVDSWLNKSPVNKVEYA